MKLVGIASTAFLFLLLGITAPAYAQREEHAQPGQQARSRQRGQYVAISQQSGRYGNRGGRIPENRLRENFGRGHMFRIDRPYVVGGYSRFQYGGFWFGLYEPWPAGWYYTDDVYVDSYDGQYYLYNRMHPGARLVINVVL